MGKKKNRKTAGATPVVTATVAPPRPWERPVACSLMTLLFLGLPLLPWHPLFFLPPVLYWPVYVGAAAGCWIRFHAGDDALPRPASVTLESSGLLLIFGSYFLLKLIGIHPSGTDENIYYYMASRMAEGAIPYRDFFFSHPPVHLLIPTAIFGITGFSVAVAKAIPVVAQAVAGLFLYLTIRPSSRTFALLALMLHLTAYQVLMGSTDMNGENLMTAFLMASMFTAVRGRFLTSGVLAGLGLGCGLYGLAAVVALAVATAFDSRRSVARYGLGFMAGFGVVMLPFAVLGGSGFVEGVF
ncbi:MAG: glycosyltransferase family 39 protein, partial [Deltaproteobacteria bacterium]|nr:glycosyltransferase family 39 protein [Deltaproteobacteria bacterium]